MARTLLIALFFAAWACACSKAEKGAPAPVTTTAGVPGPGSDPLDPRLAAMNELAFVPLEVEALVRVDLAGVAARSPDPGQSLKTFDFLLRAQQPIAWQVLSSAGIAVGRELVTLFLIVGPKASTSPDSYLVAGVGAFDEARLQEALTKAGAHVEEVGAGSLFVWRARERAKANVGAGATMPPGEVVFGDAAVGVSSGLLLFGAPDLVRQALAVRAGKGQDIRRGTLARELLAIDGTATLWGVAAPGNQAYLPSVLPGLERGHFSTVLAAPGKELDGMFTLRAEFSSPEQAEAFGKQLRSLLATADLMTGSTPLGATISEMRKNAKLTLEGKTLVASSTL